MRCATLRTAALSTKTQTPHRFLSHNLQTRWRSKATASVSEIERCDHVLAGRLRKNRITSSMRQCIRPVKNQKTMTCCFGRAKALEQGMPRRHRVEDLSRQIPSPKGGNGADTAHVSVPIAYVLSLRPKVPWEHVTIWRTALTTYLTICKLVGGRMQQHR